MIFHELPLTGSYRIEAEASKDSRGQFFRAWCLRELSAIGHVKPFVQHNQSANRYAGTLRGLHYQHPPYAEIKLVRCIRGRVLDVLVDLRFDSPTFLKHCIVELDSQSAESVYIPEGFAHGFQTLEDNTELLYFHTAFYEPGHEGGLRWNDPRLSINWPFAPVQLSERDRQLPLISDSFQGIRF